jgi:hypothetical protein
MNAGMTPARFAQLFEGQFTHWIYRCPHPEDCPVDHRELDGLTLSPAHPLWSLITGPDLPRCSCYLIGARKPKAAMRRGADFEKAIPAKLLAIQEP